jgi:hypothetical protein
MAADAGNVSDSEKRSLTLDDTENEDSSFFSNYAVRHMITQHNRDKLIEYPAYL